MYPNRHHMDELYHYYHLDTVDQWVILLLQHRILKNINRNTMNWNESTKNLVIEVKLQVKT